MHPHSSARAHTRHSGRPSYIPYRTEACVWTSASRQTGRQMWIPVLLVFMGGRLARVEVVIEGTQPSRGLRSRWNTVPRPRRVQLALRLRAASSSERQEGTAIALLSPPFVPGFVPVFCRFTRPSRVVSLRQVTTGERCRYRYLVLQMKPRLQFFLDPFRPSVTGFL
jgi:hypothetical protein